MMKPEANQPRAKREVHGFIPNIQDLGSEALANLATALAQEPGAYNSPEAVSKAFTRETNSKQK